jgi:hypothetical protein
MKNILVVMGSHPGTRDEFDWTREDCDVVVFNEAMKQPWVKRADYVTQMHLPVIWRNPGNRNDPHHYDWLKSGDTPFILMQEKYEDVPKAIKYPLDEITAMGRRYITSSAAFTIAWAIYSGYKKIEIYGVEMETNTEYAFQRPGVTYWIGLAEGRGIKVDFHGKLLTCPLYGYEGDIKFPYEFFDERIAALGITTEEAKEEYNHSREESNKQVNQYIETGSEPELIVKLLEKQATLGSLFGLQDGARQEIVRYKGKADVQRKATGDYLFSRQEFEHSASSFEKERTKAIIETQKLGDECKREFEHVRSTSNHGKRKARMNSFINAVQKYVQSAVKVGMFDGAMKENMFLMRKLDELILMAGGEKSKEVMEKQTEPV